MMNNDPAILTAAVEAITLADLTDARLNGDADPADAFADELFDMMMDDNYAVTYAEVFNAVVMHLDSLKAAPYECGAGHDGATTGTEWCPACDSEGH